MNPTPHQIDSYLRNELSSSELSAFEAEMSNNPELMDQVRFEQTVVEGISQYRKAELKARLDAIEIGSGWMGIGQLGSSALVKSVGGVLVASLVGVSAYFVFTGEENITSPEIIESIQITSPKQSESYQFEFPELSVQKVSSVVSESSPNVAEKSSATSDEKVEALPTVQKSVASVDEETEFVPVVDLPDLGELSEEKGLKIEDANLPEMNEMDVVSSKGESPISVETIQRNSESIKYKYFDGKLFLYGDFKSTPYEIIEINRPTERKLYLFYDQEYYSIIVSDKVQELSPITNHQLLQELEIVRNNKL